MKIIQSIITCAICLTFFYPVIGSAEQAHITTKIARTLAGDPQASNSHDNGFSGCMILVDVPADWKGLNCGQWIGLDCNSEHYSHTQAEVNAMWSSAQLAFALNKTVYVYIDDTKRTTVGSYCIASRIDVTR